MSVLPSAPLAMLLWGAVLTSSEPAAPHPTEHSIGSPRAGRLRGAVRLTPGPGYFVRSASTSWGTPTTVAHVRAVLASLHDAHPDVVVRIGDLSLRKGGRMPAHQAHQSGRDVDFGLVPPPGVRVRGSFERNPKAPSPPMDPRATLDLLRSLAATSGRPGGAQWVLLDYRVQQVLHAEAVAQGVPQSELDALFQYPHGRRAARGFVRHFPGHRSHMHVRFGCAPEDRACRGSVRPPRL